MASTQRLIKETAACNFVGYYIDRYQQRACYIVNL